MAYIIPDQVLQNHVCSVCKKYLSYSPTKIYRSGEIKCGRCSHPDDGGTVSIFETVARKMLFPCVNRFEGCSKMLYYKDVKEHEKNCLGTVVECPICLTSHFLLFLVQHFKTHHSQNILKSSVIDISLLNIFHKYFLKYDFETNRIFVVACNWDGKNISINCATIVDSKHERKTPKIQVSFLTDDEEQHLTDFKECGNIKYYLLDPFLEHFIYEAPLQLTQIRCKIFFDYSSQFLKVDPFSSKDNAEFKKKTPPKIYLDSKFKENYKNLDLSKFKLSTCGQKLVHNHHSLQIACDFCQNFFASSGFSKDIYYDANFHVCGTCYSRGVTKSLNNNGTQLKKLTEVVYHLLNFYCKFGCKKFFRSGELLSHEDRCTLNEQRMLSEEEYVKSFFGNEFIKGSKISKENVIDFTPYKFKGTGKIFIARDNFKCVIDYEQDTKLKLCVFHVNHKYDTRRYYISVHKWENNTFSSDYNDFSMKIEHCDGPSIFAVNLKEVKEDLEIFYDV